MSVLVMIRNQQWRQIIACVVAALIASILLPTVVHAECYRIEETVMSRDPKYWRTVYVEPKTNGRDNGVGAQTTGPLGIAVGSGVVPASFNLSSPLFQRYGSLLFSGVGSQLKMAFPGTLPYLPERVLWRCEPGEEAKGLYEYFATNVTPDNPACLPFAGANPDGDRLGVTGAYRTHFPEMGLRLTHVNSGKIVQNKWGAHRLVGLDTDSRGYVLVKVKNFSALRGDMFRINNRSYASEATWADVKTACLNTMNALIVFKWPTSPGAQLEGALADARSYIRAYVGHFNLGKSSSAATTVGSCGTELVSNPNISFSSITATELNNNESRTQQLSIRFKCQYEGNSIANASPAVSGTGSGQTAMGFAIPISNQKAALAQSLGVAGSSTAVSYLLSDGYGTDTNVATNVGVQIKWATNGAPVNLALYDPANKTGGNLDGWYGVTQNADIGQINAGGVDANGYRFYTQNFIAEFKKLPGKTVLNGGKYKATAQFIIRVQ